MSLKTQHVSKSQTPDVLIISILTKRHRNSSTVDTGISHHHSLICAMLLSTFCKGPPKIIYYSFYSNYNKEEFENVLRERLVSLSHSEGFF